MNFYLLESWLPTGDYYYIAQVNGTFPWYLTEKRFVNKSYILNNEELSSKSMLIYVAVGFFK